MGDQQSRADGRRIEYLMPPDQESSDILEFKKVCSVLLGDLYGLARLGKADLRGNADFQGKLMTLYQLIRGDMLESDIKDEIEDGTNPDGTPKIVSYYKFRELAVEIDRQFKLGFDMKMGQKILEKMNEFIRASGIIKRNIPRMVLS